MIILSATADIIRVVTASANAVHVHASWVDNQVATATPYTPGRTNTSIASAATTTVLASPAASTQRQLKKLIISSAGGTGNTVTVQFFDGSAAYQIISVTLAFGETLEYEDLAGWLVHDATGALKTTGVGSGRLMRAPQVLTSGTTYNPPAGCTAIRVRLVAGGGGGGGTTSVAVSAAVGGGGASGGYAEKYYVNPPASCTYAIGGTGTAGAATGGTGGTGGDTTFTDGTTLVTTKGGLGGIGQVGGTSQTPVMGGAVGGLSTNGNLNGAGAPGEMAFRVSGTVASSGPGAESILGGAGAGLITQGNGNSAFANTGSGGGGGCTLNGGAAATGGVGAAGVIIVEEYT